MPDSTVRLPTLLGDVEKRTSGSSRCITSVLALSSALKTKDAPRLAQAAEKGTEVQTQAYSFDIAEFDTGCSLTTMRRYTFTGILQGRPELQSTNVLSGRQFVPEAADDRQCAGPVEPVTVSVRGE